MKWADYCLWRQAFAEVMDERYYSLRWLDDRVLSGQAKFFCTDKAAILVEIKTYPTGAKDAHGLVAAGELEDIRDVLIPQGEEWGRQQGCIGALIESREGWARVLKSSGYETHQQILRKEL